ncbi:hypothetical protein QYF36_013068 [Acer negundo]|nr:hypothetical protein QYF36_013068 [Acer negundo]
MPRRSFYLVHEGSLGAAFILVHQDVTDPIYKDEPGGPICIKQKGSLRSERKRKGRSRQLHHQRALSSDPGPAPLIHRLLLNRFSRSDKPPVPRTQRATHSCKFPLEELPFIRFAGEGKERKGNENKRKGNRGREGIGDRRPTTSMRISLSRTTRSLRKLIVGFYCSEGCCEEILVSSFPIDDLSRYINEAQLVRAFGLES